MSDPLLVFINDRAVRVTPGASAAEAVAACDAALADTLRAGGAYLTDGRGIRVDAGAPVYQGAILRVVVSARQDRSEADAHA